MTSIVTARSNAPLERLFQALFPCASIAGAPKIRTSQIIRVLETEPRGVYTGAIGFIAPAGDAQFNVAIRTAHSDRRKGLLEYGTGSGSGVTWDSLGLPEHAECLLKARVITAPRPEFDLLETLFWMPAQGYYLLEAHLKRLSGSAGPGTSAFHSTCSPYGTYWSRQPLNSYRNATVCAAWSAGAVLFGWKRNRFPHYGRVSVGCRWPNIRSIPVIAISATRPRIG